MDISCKLSPKDLELHEMSNPVFWENKKSINWSSDEFVQRVLKINLQNVEDKKNQTTKCQIFFLEFPWKREVNIPHVII